MADPNRAVAPKNSGDKWPTAVHEAGHGINRRVCGMVCGHVTIVPDDDSVGHHIVRDPYQTWDVWMERGRCRELSTVMVGRILTFMAGRVAETVILGKCEGGDDDDRYQVACMLQDLYGADRERFEGRLWAAAGGLVRRHRDKIERVAAELLVRSVLATEDIDAVMGG
jgi:ATP-dependent Zn protease